MAGIPGLGEGVVNARVTASQLYLSLAVASLNSARGMATHTVLHAQPPVLIGREQLN